MRSFKVVCLSIILTVTLVLSFAMPVSALAINAAPQTYTVMVGLGNPDIGLEVMAYFPENVTIHKGDTVHWVQNTNEIHTVTFLGGLAFPELLVPAGDVGANPAISPLVFNPVGFNPVIPPGGLYSGGIGAFANSGLMGREPGQAGEFSLTFTNEGTFNYVCLVHGSIMSGSVTVVPQGTSIPSPAQSMFEGKKQMAKALAKVPGVLQAAYQQIKLPVTNGDGTMTHYVMIGYDDAQIEFVRFFPDILSVNSGDTMMFEMSPHNTAPHTVTFLNNEPEPDLAVFNGGYLYINPAVLFPSPLPPEDLSTTGVFSSGIMNPVPGTTYSLIIGDMGSVLEPYLCLLHDTSGMKGALYINAEPVNIKVGLSQAMDTIQLEYPNNPAYVVIYGSASFNVHDINFGKIFLEGAARQPFLFYRDDNRDGIPDVVLSFRTGDMNIVAGQTQITLTGSTLGGTIFSGTGQIIVK